MTQCDDVLENSVPRLLHACVYCATKQFTRLFVHGTNLKHCCCAAFPIIHGDNQFDDSFDETNFVLCGIKGIYN